MRVSVILAHPNDGSFNRAIAQTAVKQLAVNEHKIFFHDLYKENFDPLLACEEIPKDAPLPEVISEHGREIAEAEGIIIVQHVLSERGQYENHITHSSSGRARGHGLVLSKTLWPRAAYDSVLRQKVNQNSNECLQRNS